MTTIPPRPTTPEYYPTGVPNLDRVLDGGLPRGALVIVVGPPGSGKTTLANQMAFAAAQAGRKALVFTALSEPTSKLIEHLRHYTFYDAELVGGAVQFLSLEQFLSADLDAASKAIIANTRQTQTQFVVLDGFRGVRGANVNPQVARQFLYDVGTTLSVQGTTTVITSEVEPRDPSFFPETTTGDVITGLHYDLAGLRQRRHLEIVKARGAAPLSGLHEVDLNASGVIVYPRLETLAVPKAHQPTEYGAGLPNAKTLPLAPPLTSAAFDLPELDAMLDGGVTRGTNALVIGPINTGKTLLALRFALTGAEQGEPTLFLGFRETIERLQQKTASFTQFAGLDRELGPGGHLAFQRWEPIELQPDRITEHLLAAVDHIQAKRVVIDSLAELRRAVVESGPARVANFFAALEAALRLRGVTLVGVLEAADNPLTLAGDPMMLMADNIVQVQPPPEEIGSRRRISCPMCRTSAT